MGHDKPGRVLSATGVTGQIEPVVIYRRVGSKSRSHEILMKIQQDAVFLTQKRLVAEVAMPQIPIGVLKA